MQKYTNIISLGFFCSTAQELEKLGLREFSSPFDWVISDFAGIITLIDNNFEDFLNYEYLYQYELTPDYYKNIKYDISFFHDFNKYSSLKKQLPHIQLKYSKRIKRFYCKIKEPTLFVRYIKDAKELLYIEENITIIIEMLKNYNIHNDIIFIANSDILSSKIKIYNVEPDLNDTVARNFLNNNNELLKFLNNNNIYNLENKQKNINRYYRKIKKNKNIVFKIKSKIVLKFKQIFFKKYVHEHIFHENS